MSYIGISDLLSAAPLLCLGTVAAAVVLAVVLLRRRR